MYAYFVPATSGAYKFYVRADDFAQFLMNTNAVGSTNPAGAVMQVALTANDAQAYSLANSVTNTLVGGQRYYMELRFKETTGGDGGTVAVRTDNTVPGQGEVLSGAQLAFPDAVAKPTPVAVELYTGQVTVNSIQPNDLGAAFGSGGYPDLLASLNTAAFVARTPNVIGNARYFGYQSNLAQINATFDNYLGRIYANFVAPSNGLYKFYARSDDQLRSRWPGRCGDHSQRANRGCGPDGNLPGCQRPRRAGVYVHLAEERRGRSRQHQHVRHSAADGKRQWRGVYAGGAESIQPYRALRNGDCCSGQHRPDDPQRGRLAVPGSRCLDLQRAYRFCERLSRAELPGRQWLAHLLGHGRSSDPPPCDVADFAANAWHDLHDHCQ
jgi:hypothetical protein